MFLVILKGGLYFYVNMLMLPLTTEVGGGLSFCLNRHTLHGSREPNQVLMLQTRAELEAMTNKRVTQLTLQL